MALSARRACAGRAGISGGGASARTRRDVVRIAAVSSSAQLRMGRLSSIAAASGTAVRGQTRQVSGVRSLDHQQFPRVRDGTVLEMPGSKTTKTPAKEDPMLKLNLVTLLCLAGSSTAAVAEPATSASAADETIVSRPAPPATVGWYVAPTVSFTSINKTYGEM